jgi:hypothetical protein
MPETRDWKSMQEMAARLLEERTGEGMDAWNRRIREKGFTDEKGLRAWLVEQGITGYPQMYLVMEQFGYPDYLLASADDLIEGQYADRPALRPIYDAIILALPALGEVTIQTRKTYVSLVTPRRTFARVQPTSRSRIDLALRLEGQKPEGRLERSNVHASMKVQISLTVPGQVDAEVLSWLQKAYDQNS